MSARRILILTNRIPYPLNDGGNLAMKALIDGYSRSGWEVCLLAMNTSRHYIPPHELEAIYTNVHLEAVYVNNDIKLFPTLVNYLFSRQPNHAMRFSNKDFADKLAFLLGSFHPDVVQVESVFLTGYLPLIKAHDGVLTVLRMHNIEYQVWGRLADKAVGFKKIYLSSLAKRIKKYEEDAWKQYDLLLPITNADAAFASGFNSAILTVPFGIDLVPSVLHSAGTLKAYHIGAMDWLPNVEAINWFLKECWPAIHQAHPGLEFHYAGRNMPENFRHLAIAGAVCWGEVANAEQFIADKDILIVPLLSGGGIRVKILEAMAAGKIIVSTAVGMQGIDAVPGKHFLLANDPGGFLSAINWILQHAESAWEMAQAASVFARTNYDNKTVMAALIDKINNMLINKHL